MSEQTLIQLCLKGERKAQKQLYDKYSGKMMGICARYANDTAEAEDLLQEGFISIFQNLASYKEDGSLINWIRKIMLNTIIQEHRKKNALKRVADEQPHTHAPETPVEIAQTNDLLSMIQSMPTGYRTIFNLYAIEGYTHVEIAKMLEMSVGNSKSQYSRARALLQKQLATENIETGG